MSDPRTAREALLAELLGSVDQLLDRQEQLAGTISAAAERLEAAAKTVALATAANSDAAKASVGEYITRRVNEATDQALQDTRKAIDEAAAAALGKALLAGHGAPPTVQPTVPSGRAWTAFAAGVGAAGVLAALAWLIAQ